MFSILIMFFWIPTTLVRGFESPNKYGSHSAKGFKTHWLRKKQEKELWNVNFSPFHWPYTLMTLRVLWGVHFLFVGWLLTLRVLCSFLVCWMVFTPLDLLRPKHILIVYLTSGPVVFIIIGFLYVVIFYCSKYMIKCPNIVIILYHKSFKLFPFYSNPSQ